MSSVVVDEVSKVYGSNEERVHALRDVSLAIDEGEFVVLLGPSGCGKTTLLRSIAGLIRPSSGSILIDGKLVFSSSNEIDVKPNKRPIGMVFQNYALWPHMTVSSNVSYPLRAQHRKDLIATGRHEQVLELVQCSMLAQRYPSQLSGGQQQRIALARALSAEPAVMLLDEPLSNLDAQLRLDLRQELRVLHQRVGFTGVYVTHDQGEALHLGGRVIVMNQGRIEQEGAPREVFESPATEYVARFLGIRNHLTFVSGRAGLGLTWNGGVVSGALDALLAGVDGGPQYEVYVRSVDMRIHQKGTSVASSAVVLEGLRVADEIYQGSHYLVSLQSKDERPLEVELAPGVARPAIGDSVDLLFDVAAALVY